MTTTLNIAAQSTVNLVIFTGGKFCKKYLSCWGNFPDNILFPYKVILVLFLCRGKFTQRRQYYQICENNPTGKFPRLHNLSLTTNLPNFVILEINLGSRLSHNRGSCTTIPSQCEVSSESKLPVESYGLGKYFCYVCIVTLTFVI